MPEVDRLSVVLDLEMRNYARGMQTSAKLARSTAAEINKIGDSSTKTAAKAKTAFGQISQAIQNAQKDAAKGINLKVGADTSQLDRVSGVFSRIRADAEQGATFRLSADMSGIAGIATEISGLRADALKGATFTIKGDTSGLLTTGAELDHIDEKADNLDGRNVKMNIDAGAASALPTLLGDATFALNKFETLAVAVAVTAMPAMIAGIGALGSAAAVGAVGLTGLTAALGAGVAGAGSAAAGALGLATGGLMATGVAAKSAIANVMGVGKSFGSMQLEGKFATDQIKAFTSLVEMMPPGTDAAAAAQQRLSLAQEYQSRVTEQQIAWWGKYGEAANSLTSSLYELRFGLYSIISDTGGQLIPTIQRFVDVGVNQLPGVSDAFQVLTWGVQEGTAELLTYLESARGFQTVENLVMAVGFAAGPATNILANGFIVALEAIQPVIPASQAVLATLSMLSREAGVWAQTAEGQQTIADIWATLFDYAGLLGGAVTELGAAFGIFFGELAGSGVISFMADGFYQMAASIHQAVSEAKESGGLAAFFEDSMPILSAAKDALDAVTYEVFRVVGAITSMESEATGNLVMVDIFNAIRDSAAPLGDLLINTFEQLGPVLADLLPDLAQLASIFLGATPEIKLFLESVDWLAESFNSLDDGTQATIARIAALSLLFKGFVGGSGITGVASSVIGLYTNFMLLANARAGVQALGGTAVTFGSIASSAGSAALAVGNFALAWAGVAALALIALDIIVHWPDITAGFSAAYADAQAGGSGVGMSFMAGLSAAIDATTIGSTIFAAVDAATSGLDMIGLWAGRPTIMDVIMGNATMEEAASGGNLLAQIGTQVQAVWDWMGTLAPETNLIDLLMGRQEDTGDNPILNTLSAAWDGVMEWWTGLAPETTVLDVLMGNGEAADNPLLSSLTSAWDGVMEWWAGLAPEVTLLDVLMGNGEAEDNPLLAGLTTAWEGVLEWLGGLVPDITLMDVLMGLGADEDQAASITEHLSAIWEGIKTDVNDALTSLYNDYWLYYFGSGGVLETTTSDFFNRLYNDYFLYYLGIITTAVSDFWSVLYNNYWLYYQDIITTAVSDWWSVLYNDYWLYYFGALTTAVSDFWSVLYNDYWLYYQDIITTAVSDWWSVLYNDYWLYYTELLTNVISDFWEVLYNDYWLYYTDLITTTISDWWDVLYNDYFLYYAGSDGVLVTAVSDAWTAITDGVSGFVEEFKTILGDGFREAVDTALGWLQSLLEGAASVLSAIGADDTAAALTSAAAALPISGESAYHGLVTDQMAGGGTRGGMGHHGAHPQIIEWDEQSNGREWWIATGDANKRRQVGLLSGAADDLGMGIVPQRAGAQYRKPAGQMARGGFAGGSLWHMAIGGGTDVGPGGLSGRAAELANEEMSKWGVWTNTYVGGEFPHGSLHGNSPENTWDTWNDSWFGALDIGTGDDILAWLYSTAGNELDTVIWQGMGEGPGGAFPDDDHYDHLHASVGGSGLGNTAGIIANMLFAKAKSLWDALISSLGVMDSGTGPLWDSVDEYVNEMPTKIWEFILSKIPRGFGGGVSGLTGDISQMLQQGINAAGWSAEDLAALTQLWSNESGFDPNAVNPDSGAYGIPQINPSSWGYPAPLGDAAAQIAWGMDYIAERYGSPSAALDFWNANNWYHGGGVIPGAGNKLVPAEAGERVLPKNINAGFERLANSVSVWSSRRGASPSGGGLGDDHALLEEILGAIQEGNDNPTPVKVDNADELEAAFVAGALAAQAGEAGKLIQGKNLAEGLRYARQMNGSAD